MEYGMFDLSVFFEGKFDQDIFNAIKFLGYNQDGMYNWDADYINDHYRGQDVVALDESGNTIAVYPANEDAKYPRLNSTANFTRISSFYVENGSYLRLKNIQLGISLPEKWINKLSLGEFRVYAGARNILTFTKYSGMDPELPMSTDNDENLVSGLDKAAYPQARAFLFGANIKF